MSVPFGNHDRSLLWQASMGLYRQVHSHNSEVQSHADALGGAVD